MRWGAEVPRGSLLLRKKHAIASVSEIEETDSAVWLDVSRGSRPPTIFEQVHQQNGYALVLLTIEEKEIDEEADDSNWNRRNTVRGR